MRILVTSTNWTPFLLPVSQTDVLSYLRMPATFGLNDLLTLFAGVLSFLSLNLWTLLKDIVGFKLFTDV